MAARRSRISPNSEANLESSIRISDWPCCTIEPSCTSISPTMPPSRLWTTWVCRDGTTRPLPRLTSSRIAKCAQSKNVSNSARNVSNSMREVRGVRKPAAARMSLAKAKSDDIGLLHIGGVREIRRNRVLRRGRGRFTLQQRQDFVTRPVGHQAATIEQQQPIHHAEQ